MKLSKAQGFAVFIVLVSIATTAILSFGILWTHHPLNNEFLVMWGPDFITGCCISIPVGFILVPVIKRWVDKFTIQ